MLKKDEVSKYTVPKNALDMLEWPPYSSKYTAKDIPMTDSNIQPPSTTDTGTNLVPGTEVTTSPGLIPETTTEYDPGTANVTATVGDPDITEVPPTDYAAAVDYQVDSMPESHHPDMPTYTESEIAHQEMMRNPQYAIATHEHTLNKFADLLEQVVARLNDIEAKLDSHITDVTGPDPNNPLKDYPEVQAHQNR